MDLTGMDATGAVISKLLDLGGDVLCVLRQDGSIQEMHGACECLLGFSSRELTHRKLTELVHPDDVQPCREHLAALSKGCEIVTFVNRLRTKDGGFRRLHWRAAAEGKPAGIYALGRGIAEPNPGPIGVLAGGIAHQFNNLLTGILGNATLALEQLPPDSRSRGYITEVVLASNRAAELTRQLLAYAGRTSRKRDPLNLTQLISGVQDLLQTALPEKVELRVELDPDLPRVEADGGEIRQLVLNLVVNAGEAIGERGRIILRTAKRRISDCQIAAEGLYELVPGDYVALEVADTGAGMDGETQGRIFDPFFSTKFTGRGLGLASVWGIVRSSKGAIQVWSEPGQGSVFRVLLPTATSAEGAAMRRGL